MIQKNKIELDDNGHLLLSGFMNLEDVKNIKVNKIYWDWPFETGLTSDQIDENDIIDSSFIRKTYGYANFSYWS